MKINNSQAKKPQCIRDVRVGIVFRFISEQHNISKRSPLMKVSPPTNEVQRGRPSPYRYQYSNTPQFAVSLISGKTYRFPGNLKIQELDVWVECRGDLE